MALLHMKDNVSDTLEMQRSTSRALQMKCSVLRCEYGCASEVQGSAFQVLRLK